MEIYLTHHLVLTLYHEQVVAEVQESEDAAQSPHVYGLGDGEAQDDFRCPVCTVCYRFNMGLTQTSAGSFTPNQPVTQRLKGHTTFHLRGKTGQTKVYEFHSVGLHTVLQHHIIWLQVRVNHTKFLQGIKGRQQLQKQEEEK